MLPCLLIEQDSEIISITMLCMCSRDANYRDVSFLFSAQENNIVGIFRENPPMLMESLQLNCAKDGDKIKVNHGGNHNLDCPSWNTLASYLNLMSFVTPLSKSRRKLTLSRQMYCNLLGSPKFQTRPCLTSPPLATTVICIQKNMPRARSLNTTRFVKASHYYT